MNLAASTLLLLAAQAGGPPPSAAGLPTQTAVPIYFTSTISAAGAHAEDRVQAKTMQVIRLTDGRTVPEGTSVVGHVAAEFGAMGREPQLTLRSARRAPVIWKSSTALLEVLPAGGDEGIR